jgi:pimeloyl-ACP methyl ester carboxylesterase
LLLIFSCGKEKQNVNESQETRIENENVYIHHQECGKGEVTLLFVHGWCIDQTYWFYQTDEFCKAYNVVSIDLPGFGNSGKNRNNFSMEAYGKDVNAVIDQLGLTNVILVGHSMGGDIILEAALNSDNVIALIGIDNFKDVGIPFTEETQREVDNFMKMLTENFHEIAPAYAEGSLFHTSTDSLVVRRVMDSFGSADSTAAISSLENLLSYGQKESEQLAKLKQKLYLINSDATPTNTSGLEATGVDFEVIDIPATGHYPMIEKPVLFNQLLDETVQKIISRKVQ